MVWHTCNIGDLTPVVKAGVHGNCIRVLCPLTTSDGELDEGLDAWEEALAAVLG